MKHLKTFNQHLNESMPGPPLDKGQESATFLDFQKKLNGLIDLWDVDILTNQVEENMRDLSGDEYNKFHREIIPAWIAKHWSKDMLYHGENLFDYLYKEVHPILAKYLTDRGIESQECFVSYMVGASNPEFYKSDDGKFRMGFDIWKDDQSGWACFTFIGRKTNHVNEIVEVAGKDLREKERNLDNLKNDNDINCIIEFGTGTFYNAKSLYGKGLHDDLSDGGYALRLD